MKKIVLIILTAAVVLSLVLFLPACKSNEKEFNIILISIDTLRADHLGCYRYPHPTSPAIDAFAKDAVLFRQCIAQCTSTLASHASIMTSLIVSHHSAYFTRTQPLPDQVKTMAEFLKEKNYRTVSYNDGGQIAAKFGLDQGFDIYESLPFDDVKEMQFKRIVEKTESWIDTNPGEKFFLFLHTYETHHPYTPEPHYLDMFEEDYNGNLPEHISVELLNRINKDEVAIDDQDKQHIIDTYDAEIREMDDSFARLIAFLKKKKLYDNTLIIFTSDHGEEFGEHGIWGMHSHTLFNDQLLVPLIMKLPGSQLAGRKINPMARSIDILPTVLDLLGQDIPKDLEGATLIPLAQGRAEDKNMFAISQRDMPKTYPRKYWSVIQNNWKLYDKKLYNLLTDPGELTDATEAYRNLKSRLESMAISFMKRRAKRLDTRKIKIDKKLKEKLKTLGYVD